MVIFLDVLFFFSFSPSTSTGSFAPLSRRDLHSHEALTRFLTLCDRDLNFFFLNLFFLGGLGTLRFYPWNFSLAYPSMTYQSEWGCWDNTRDISAMLGLVR